MKIRDRNVSSNNTVPATDDNFGVSTGLAKKMQGSAGYVYLYSCPPYQKNEAGGGWGRGEEGGGDACPKF